MKQSGISPTRIKDWSHRLTAFDKVSLGGDNFRSMAVLLENIRFAPDECLRLLRWQGNAQSLQSLEAGGKRASAAARGCARYSRGLGDCPARWAWRFIPRVR